MATPSWLTISESEIADIPSIVKVTRDNNVLTLFYSDGTTTVSTYPSYVEAQTAFSNISSLVGSKAIGSPTLYKATPAAFLNAGLPAAVVITGIGFDATITTLVFAQNPLLAPSSDNLLAVVADANTINATVPVGTAAGVYDLVYGDSNGNIAILEKAIVVGT